MPDDKTGLLVRIARLYKVFDFQEASPQVKFKIYMGMLKEMFFMLQKIQILEDELRDVENGLAMIDRGFYSFLQGKEQLNIDLNAHIRTFIEVRSYFQSARSLNDRNDEYYMCLHLSRYNIYILCDNLQNTLEIPSHGVSIDKCNRKLKKIYDTLEHITENNLEKIKNDLFTLDNDFYNFLKRKKQPSRIAFHKEIVKFFQVRSHFQSALFSKKNSPQYYTQLLLCRHAIYILLEALLYVWP